MKKITQKVTFLLFSVMLLIAVSSISTAFAAEKTMSITIRIEGIEKNLFYATEQVPYTDSLTLAQALTYIDTKEDSISITGVDTGYLTDINGDTAGKFGGWDGWLYKVNGKDPVVSIGSQELSEGDNVVLYYGDPFGVGMQFPVADTSKLKDGVITFTSSDTTYDANYNPIVKVNPVVGATVTWSNGNTTKEFITDKNGSVKIDTDLLADGAHAVQISKTGDTKLPLALRFAPDYVVSVNAADNGTADDSKTENSDTAVTTSKDSSKADTDSKDLAKNDTSSNTSSSDSNTDASAPKTGEQMGSSIIYLLLAAVSLAGVKYLRRKDCYEK